MNNQFTHPLPGVTVDITAPSDTRVAVATEDQDIQVTVCPAASERKLDFSVLLTKTILSDFNQVHIPASRYWKAATIACTATGATITVPHAQSTKRCLIDIDPSANLLVRHENLDQFDIQDIEAWLAESKKRSFDRHQSGV